MTERGDEAGENRAVFGRIGYEIFRKFFSPSVKVFMSFVECFSVKN